MKKKLIGLLSSLLVVSSAFPQTYANHSYLSVRSTNNFNRATGALGTAKPHATGNKLGVDLSVSGFYRTSHHTDKTARYFGGGNLSQETANGTFDLAKSTATADVHGYDVDHATTDSQAASSLVTLAPAHTEYGAQFSVTKCLGMIHEGLSLHVDAPLVRTKTTSGATYSEVIKNSVSGEGGHTISDILSGKTVSKVATSTQDAVAFARLVGPQTKTALGDIRAGVSYRIMSSKKEQAHVGAHVIAPTGNKAQGVNVLEPIVGNGGHLGLGLNGRYACDLLSHKGIDVSAVLSADYTYLFKNEQVRTLGVYNHLTSSLASASAYRVLGKAFAKKGIPGANELTRTVSVTPGSQFVGKAALNAKWKNFSAQAFYSFSAREKENVELVGTWIDNQVGFIKQEFDLSSAPVIGEDGQTLGGPIQGEGKVTGKRSNGLDLDPANAATYYVTTDACATPAQLTHMVGGSVGYSLCSCKFPLSVSAGGAYEFAPKTSNSALESWSVFGKVSVCF